ncbi:MAG: GTPase HflX [Candidatus Omnitrophica bacterium]|jgi:GTP-binding protein HflX|nr:GTPase HflX [Candidatus Omnitrophota bacterium]MDD5654458.1 GTPase HflX [Candidatus Omnitrophota bacterium]
MERTLLVTIKLDYQDDNWRLEDIADELESLTEACGAKIIDHVTCLRDRPTAGLFIGSGKAEEIALICQEEKIDTVIFSEDLSGVQQRNLEDILGKKTIDRTQLILHIFAKHASSLEGKMQVELAQLQYIMPRLTGKGIILSRQGGGIGTSGPGETKLEVDRRRIRKRIEKLKDDLKHLSLHRTTMRKKRQENSVASIALVGYTNAGKSTLLNLLTGSNQVVRNGLFTTLDPLTKSLRLPNGENVIISDTVGFLHNLPHHLIEAFKATLEEVSQSDLLIHVLDVSHQRTMEHYESVLEVLKELESDQKPIINALNKIDLLEDKAWLGRMKEDFPGSIAISAKSGENIDTLIKEIQKKFVSKMTELDISIPNTRMDLINLFYREGQVKDIQYLEKSIKIKLFLPTILYHKLLDSKQIENNC